MSEKLDKDQASAKAMRGWVLGPDGKKHRVPGTSPAALARARRRAETQVEPVSVQVEPEPVPATTTPPPAGSHQGVAADPVPEPATSPVSTEPEKPRDPEVLYQVHPP